MMGTMKTNAGADVVIEGHRRDGDTWWVTWQVGDWQTQDLSDPVETEATVTVRGSQWGPRHDHACEVEIAADLPDHIHQALVSYLADAAGAEGR